MCYNGVRLTPGGSWLRGPRPLRYLCKFLRVRLYHLKINSILKNQVVIKERLLKPTLVAPVRTVSKLSAGLCSKHP